MEQLWLPEPPPGTKICLGFDGSDVNDWTAIKAETQDGLLFTPRRPNGEPTIWDPSAGLDHRVSRLDVAQSLEGIFERFSVERMYCDPPRWETDIEQWRITYGERRVIDWPTYRRRQMHASLERFVTDIITKRMTHDGCPITSAHVANARVKKIPGDQYLLAKPNDNQKIDAAMAAVLAHEAAADARASGWDPPRGGLTRVRGRVAAR